MRKNPRLLTSFATAMSFCNVEAETLEASAAGDAVQAHTATAPAGATAEALAAASAAAATETARKRAAAANFLPIVRGRLPLIFVHAVRFDPVIGAMGNKDIASKFATSVGKVFDIKKGRNFGYIMADYKPSVEDLAAGQAWIDQVGAENAKGMSALGDKSLMTTVLKQYKAGGLATAEDIAKLTSQRASTRPAKAPATTTGVMAAKTEAVQANSGTADDLLS